MEYELQHIEPVVAKVLSLTLCGDLRDEEFQKAEEFLSTEFIRIKTAFRRMVLRPKGKAYFTEYFGLHEVALIELMDNIFEARAEISGRHQPIFFCNGISASTKRQSFITNQRRVLLIFSRGH